MNTWVRLAILGLLIAIAGGGCDVDEEKIALWKGTVNGPKKLVNTVTDPEIPTDLRAKAGVALIEINAWDLFRDALKKASEQDTPALMEAMVPQLVQMFDRGGEKAITKSQVDAKDGLFIALDYSADAVRVAAEEALIAWYTADYNKRALAGQYNVTVVFKKIGAKAGLGLVPLLDLNQIAIEPIADLIGQLNAPTVVAAASEQLAKALLSNPKEINTPHLTAAATIGGNPIATALITLAADTALHAKGQRFALRALSQGMEERTIAIGEPLVLKLFAIAESSDYDPHHREESYYVIAQAGRVADIQRIRPLLNDKRSFWRAVAFRCILRIDGENQLGDTLREMARLKIPRTQEDVIETIERISSFPKLVQKVRPLINDPEPFVRGIAVGAVGKIGSKDDLNTLKGLASSNVRLPKGFEHQTLGAAARAAIEAIQKRG
ncbi:MAG: HEAT repeat domain-containing protein [Myxococcota bacterium]|nr:HEAT repeat domain-containing protein [Myxococcota bacterium]